jgi:hypothetical protein
MKENTMDVPKLQTKINQDQNLETRLENEKELFHGRKQKFDV